MKILHFYLIFFLFFFLKCLQWETRQIRILKAGTLEHIIKYILLITQQQKDERNHIQTGFAIEEERNDISHTMHVIFCTYRVYCQPYHLFSLFSKYCSLCSREQFKFVFHYWLNNYPEDFLTSITIDEFNLLSPSSSELSSDLESHSSKNEKNPRLIDLFLCSEFLDEALYKKAHSILKDYKTISNASLQKNGNYVSFNFSSF